MIMSESLYVLLNEVDPYLPPTDDIRDFVNRYSLMDAHSVYKSICSVPFISSNLSVIRDIVSDMNRSDLAKVLISYLDIHYHEILAEINDDEKKRLLFRNTVSLALDDMLGGST
jgi:hypothetical protein